MAKASGWQWLPAGALALALGGLAWAVWLSPGRGEIARAQGAAQTKGAGPARARPAAPVATPDPAKVGPRSTFVPQPQPPPLPARVAHPPSATLSTYTDAGVGFSFRYPSNWSVDAPPQLTGPPDGYGVTVRNFNNVPVDDQQFPPGELKIEVRVFSGLSAYRGVEDWMRRSGIFEQSATASGLQAVPLPAAQGVQVHKWVARGGRIPQGVLHAAVIQGDQAYLFSGYPATSQYAAVFESVVQSFRLPTRFAFPPAASLKAYTDPNVGFSFAYPDNWLLVDPPPKKSVDPLPPDYGVTVQNYGNATYHVGFAPDQLKVEVHVVSLAGYDTVEDWISRSGYFPNGTETVDLRSVTIAGAPARRWLARGPHMTQGAQYAAVPQGERLFVIAGYPAGSQYAAAFDTIVQSFRL